MKIYKFNIEKAKDELVFSAYIPDKDIGEQIDLAWLFIEWHSKESNISLKKYPDLYLFSVRDSKNQSMNIYSLKFS